MCYIPAMLKISKTAKPLAIAIVLGATPTAIAQTDAPEAGIPYQISFNGEHHPANLEKVEYPHTAAIMNKDGECRLSVATDTAQQVADISIVACTDTSFKDVMSRFIRNQTFPGTLSPETTTHSLTVTWTIGEESIAAPKTLQLAAR